MKQKFLFPKILIGVVAVFLFIFVLNLFSSQVRNYFYLASLPLQKTFWAAGQSASGFFGSFLKTGSLAKENEILKNENYKLLSQVAFLQAIKNANEAQSMVSASCQNAGFELTMAGIIGLNADDRIMINKGLDNGVLEGMPVISQQNVLFGKVSKTYKDFSEVTLISNKESVVNVKIQRFWEEGQEPKEVYGVVKGGGGLKAYLDFVLVDDQINENDVLITSALEGTFPKDILVGRITKVEKNDQSPHQQAQLELFLDVKTDNVFIITNYKR